MNTDIPPSTSLYALQQTSSKLSPDHYQVLSYLNLAPLLTRRTYGKSSKKLRERKNYISFQMEQFSDGAASEQKPAVEKAE